MWIDNSAIAHLRDVAEWPDLGERYEVRARLGRGGMGVVYSAHDRVLGREVAVKVLDDLHRSADAARLLSEARILGQLEHPGIVPVHDAGTLPDGRVYYVMKLVRGERLDAAMQPRTLNQRLDLFLRICDAVSFAHARGIVHRDLKPDNIMLGAFGEVLVLDWGIATMSAEGAAESASADDAVDAEENAQRTEISGTPGYMAPEQQHGALHVDQRADVYSLGVILLALITQPAPKPLMAIAKKAQAAAVEARYATVQDFARDVMRFRDGDPVAAYQETVFERLARFYRRYQLPILLVLAYVIMRLALLAWRGI